MKIELPFTSLSEIFYLFEPLILGVTQDENEIKQMQEVLQRIIDCDLPLYSNFKSDRAPDFVQQSCSERDFCFAQETKQFCQEPFCSKDSTGDQVYFQKFISMIGPLRRLRVRRYLDSTSVSIGIVFEN